MLALKKVARATARKSVPTVIFIIINVMNDEKLVNYVLYQFECMTCVVAVRLYMCVCVCMLFFPSHRRDDH